MRNNYSFSDLLNAENFTVTVAGLMRPMMGGVVNDLYNPLLYALRGRGNMLTVFPVSYSIDEIANVLTASFYAGCLDRPFWLHLLTNFLSENAFINPVQSLKGQETHTTTRSGGDANSTQQTLDTVPISNLTNQLSAGTFNDPNNLGSYEDATIKQNQDTEQRLTPEQMREFWDTLKSLDLEKGSAQFVKMFQSGGEWGGISGRG